MVGDGFLQHVIHNIRVAAVLLAICLMVSGCGLFHVTLQADPAVIDNVRGIGKVLGETTTEGTWEGTTEIENILVVDVGSTSSKEALNKAFHLLGERGWKVTSQNIPKRVMMESTIWEDVHLSVDISNSLDVDSYPEEIRRIIGGMEVNPELLLILSIKQL